MNIKAKGRRKVRIECKVILGVVLIIATLLIAKANEPRIVGYTYDSGSTVWEMAERCCPNGVDMQEVAMEIERVNGIKDSVVHKYAKYKVPVYE